MELTTDDLDAAEAGEPVRIDKKGQTFYFVIQKLFEQLTRGHDATISVEEIDLLADETDAIISESETDEY